MLWPAGVVADFVDNFNTGIMVRSGTEVLHLSVQESCRFAFNVDFIQVYIQFQRPKSHVRSMLSIALGFVHCSYSRANSVRKGDMKPSEQPGFLPVH